MPRALPPSALQPGHGRCLLLLTAWCAILFFHGLDRGELYRTESLRALLAEGFLRSGNWVAPTLYGEPLLTKPPGMYAAIALASLPAGRVTAVTARLPSAMAATAIVLLFYWHFDRQLGRRAGLVAALIVPASLLWLDRAPSAEIDMLQVAWVAAAVLFFLRALEAEEDSPPGRSFRWWLAALLCVAGGFLTKWTAPAFFYLSALPLLWWRGRLRLLFGWPHLASAGVAATLGLLWIGAAVQSRAGTSLPMPSGKRPCRVSRPWNTVGRTPGRRFLRIPSRFWPPACRGRPLRRLTLRPGFRRCCGPSKQRLLQALHCWVWPNLLFWSIVRDIIFATLFRWRPRWQVWPPSSG